MWYLERGVKPNLDCLENIKTAEDLKKKLLNIVSDVDARSIRLDLEALIDNREFVRKLSKDIKEILKREIEEKL